MKNILGLILLFLTSSAIGETIAISPAGYLYHDMGDIRVLFDTRSLKKNVFSIENLNKYGYFYSLDPTGKRHAALKIVENPGADCENMAEGRYFVRVIDLTSNDTLALIQDAGPRYSFSPDGKSIVYISEYPGSWPEGCKAPEGFERGVWIYKFEDKSHIRINTSFQWNMNINWSSHDNSIYVTNNINAYKYNPKTSNGENTNNSCLYFTRTGDFCISAPFEDSSRIYKMPENEVAKDLEEMISRNNKKYPGIYFISLLRKNNSAIFSISNTEKVIFNFNKKEVVGGFEGQLIGFDPEEKRMAIHPYHTKNGVAIDWNTVEIIALEAILK